MRTLKPDEIIYTDGDGETVRIPIMKSFKLCKTPSWQIWRVIGLIIMSLAISFLLNQ